MTKAAKKAKEEEPRPPGENNRRLEYVALEELKGAPRNPKKHMEADIGKSIGRFGYVEPVVMDERTGRLVAGHGRVQSLRVRRAGKEQPPEGVKEENGQWLVPVLRGWASRSDTEAEAYLVASNQLTIGGGWESEVLGKMLGDLAASDALDGVGFSEEELSRLLASIDDTGGISGDEDSVPDVAPEDVYVKQGELWLLGRHRLIVGDCRDADAVARLMDGAKINVAVTSPPYASQRAYDESSGFKPIHPAAFVEWYRAVSDNVEKHLAQDGSYFVNIKEHCEDGQRSLYVKDLTIAHARAWGWRFVDELCWVKPGFPGENLGRFKNGWEPVFHFTRARGHKHRPDAVSHPSEDCLDYSPESRHSMSGVGWVERAPVQTVAGLARPTNVMKFSAGKTGSDMKHSAAYPVGLPEFFINAFSDAGDIIFDPFMGSGTTIIAAEKTGRTGYGLELSARYAQVIITRWEAASGKKAELAAD